jgi:hypothetical protein
MANDLEMEIVVGKFCASIFRGKPLKKSEKPSYYIGALKYTNGTTMSEETHRVVISINPDEFISTCLRKAINTNVTVVEEFREISLKDYHAQLETAKEYVRSGGRNRHYEQNIVSNLVDRNGLALPSKDKPLITKKKIYLTTHTIGFGSHQGSSNRSYD